jgi:Shikimate 5-dehydrogenase
MKMIIDQLKFNMDTKLYPIVGHPMGQSSASFAYNPFFVHNGINEIMWPVDILPGKIGDFLAAAKVFGIRHIGLTMPHKSAVIPFLDDVDEKSRIFNSVNTIRIDEDGTTHGIGMDGRGCMAAIRQAGVDVKDMHVSILGSGSIVGVILLELANAGAKKATLVNRSPERSKSLVDTVNKYTAMGIECLPQDAAGYDKAAAECDFLLQATPLGMFGYPEDYRYLGFMDKLKLDAVFMETIVNPHSTSITKKAEEKGLTVIYGIDMMLCQIGEIFEFAFGFPPKEGSFELAKKSVYGYFGLED